MRHRTIIALLPLLLLPAGLAQAGTMVESTSSENGEQTLSVSAGHVRIDPARSGAPAMLFDARRGQLVLLNRPARQYNVMTADRLDALEARIAEQRGRLQEAIEEGDDTDRKRLQRRLERLPEIDATGGFRIEASGEFARINGFDCERAIARDAGERTHRLCISPVGDLGLSEDSATTLRQLFDFLARMRTLLGGGSAPFDARLLQATLAEADAFPIQIERTEDDSNWTVRGIETADIPAARFEVPKDFSEGARLGGE